MYIQNVHNFFILSLFFFFFLIDRYPYCTLDWNSVLQILLVEQPLRCGLPWALTLPTQTYVCPFSIWPTVLLSLFIRGEALSKQVQLQEHLPRLEDSNAGREFRQPVPRSSHCCRLVNSCLTMAVVSTMDWWDTTLLLGSVCIWIVNWIRLFYDHI